MNITFEGGDGIKHPKLFDDDSLRFTGNGLSLLGNVVLEDGIASNFSNKNSLCCRRLLIDPILKNSY